MTVNQFVVDFGIGQAFGYDRPARFRHCDLQRTGSICRLLIGHYPDVFPGRFIIGGCRPGLISFTAGKNRRCKEQYPQVAHWRSVHHGR